MDTYSNLHDANEKTIKEKIVIWCLTRLLHTIIRPSYQSYLILTRHEFCLLLIYFMILVLRLFKRFYLLVIQ
jgi:hypothetical protein